jgi:hypothetical protein
MPDDTGDTRAEALQMSRDLVAMIDSEEAQTAGITDWLEAAMREREKALNSIRSGRRWYVDPSDGSVTEPQETWADGSDRLPNRHGVWVPVFDPEQALAAVARDRALMQLHAGRGHSCPAVDDDGDYDHQARFYDHEVCPVVQNLAANYGWTGDGSV